MIKHPIKRLLARSTKRLLQSRLSEAEKRGEKNQVSEQVYLTRRIITCAGAAAASEHGFAWKYCKPEVIRTAICAHLLESRFNWTQRDLLPIRYSESSIPWIICLFRSVILNICRTITQIFFSHGLAGLHMPSLLQTKSKLGMRSLVTGLCMLSLHQGQHVSRGWGEQGSVLWTWPLVPASGPNAAQPLRCHSLGVEDPWFR